MKEIKVFLQYPWRFPDSPYYKYLIDYSPEKIQYLNVKKQKGAITNSKKFWILTRLKVNIRRVANWLRLPFPNAHLTKSNEEYDIIHCAHCLSKNKDKPWVSDIENVWSMWISGINKTDIGKRLVKDILLRENCKKILPWTNNVKKEIIREFPEIKDKIETVYPAINYREDLSLNKKSKLVLFSGRDFRLKGGIIALKIMRELKKRDFEINCVVISRTPKKLKREFKEIKFYDLLPQKDLFNFLDKASIFLYPSLMDTFGFGILESMSFGTPIFALNTIHTKAIKEIIENGKTGFIFDTKININKENKIEEDKIIEGVSKKIILLLKDKKLLEEMGKNCIETIKYGKFSIKERNKKLRKIYEEALNH